MPDLFNVYDTSNCIIIHNDGKEFRFEKGSRQYFELLAAWAKMIDDAHDMPAFGVSLNRYAVEELKRGVWIEFVFDGVKEIYGMPFERLLIEVKDDYSGFNIIRFNKSVGYDGRCYYLDLVGKNMADLSALMRDLTV